MDIRIHHSAGHGQDFTFAHRVPDRSVIQIFNLLLGQYNIVFTRRKFDPDVHEVAFFELLRKLHQTELTVSQVTGRHSVFEQHRLRNH
ncbi:hypothetical protein D3C75_1048500 [compost metagenome]